MKQLHSFGKLLFSNLGFSNHFTHHFREDGLFEQYAQNYMEILAVLKPGASFHYASSLPFIEQYLDKCSFWYHIMKSVIT